MATLTQNTPRAYGLGDINALPLLSGSLTFEGAAVGAHSSGNVRPLVAGDKFRGFARAKADNSGGVSGAAHVDVRECGLISLPVTGATGAVDVGKAVYASDDNAFTLTKGTNSFVGYVSRSEGGTQCLVEFDSAVGSDAELTDSTGGTASDTLATITDGATANAIASLAAKVNTLLRTRG